MAHFAELDSSNKVIRVIVVNNEVMLDSHGVEQEQLGVDFVTNLLGGVWKQTSYNGNFRKNYAGIGYMFDPNADVFIPPKPFPSWVLDTETYQWVPPAPYPTDESMYKWDEVQLSWVLIQE